jgi:hypothetical protein
MLAERKNIPGVLLTASPAEYDTGISCSDFAAKTSTVSTFCSIKLSCARNSGAVKYMNSNLIRKVCLYVFTLFIYLFKIAHRDTEMA